MSKKFQFNIKLNKYQKVLIFFAVLFFILWSRLFFIQVVKWNEYWQLLFSQHYSVSDLEPERWNIYLEDKNWKKIPLTENINLYELYADPYIIWDENKLWELLGPILYNHFCDRNRLEKVNKLTCVENIEKWSWKQLIKEEKEKKTELLTWNLQNTQEIKKEIDLSYITTWILQETINNQLSSMIKKSYITRPYIGFFEDDNIIKQVENIDWVFIQNNNYVYVNVDNMSSNTSKQLYNTLNPKYDNVTKKYLDKILQKRPRRYVKIADHINPTRINEIKKMKDEYKDEKQDRVPLFHGIWYKKQPFRYYPHNNFLSHVIWYINNDNWVWWIEEYYNDILKWEKWQIVWMNTPWIWEVWSSSMDIKESKDWWDINLTIDYTLQKKVEEIIKRYYYELKADDISVVIMNPHNGKVKALAWYPNFNPNNWKDIYKIKPLTKEYEYLIDKESMWETYYDIPILYETWWKLQVATTEERYDKNIKKYIYKNILWPRTFVNHIISSPYEPWSIFKVITEAIAIDTNDIWLYDYYQDDWKIEVWPYTIRNVEKKCEWYNTFLHALERSCNVWMVRIVLKTWKDIFYNYLKQLWLWKKTWIQLAWEERWKISALEKFSQARFFNNSFGQWLLVTPMQMAISFSAMVNGWYLLKPTIVEKIENENSTKIIWKYIKDKIFATRISKDIIYALYSTIYQWDLINLALDGYTLWWKTWTSQISYKWKYQQWKWWTVGSFVWITTKENLKYVIAVKATRPRTCQWWLCSAWKVYEDISKFIIEYEGIQK